MTAEELKTTGRKLFNERHYAEAVPLLKSAVDVFSADETLWQELVLAASRDGQCEKAVEFAKLGLQQLPRSDWLWRQLGSELTGLARFDEAEQALNNSHSFKSDAPWLWRYFAKLYQKRKDYAAEAEALEQLEALGEADANDLNAIGIAYHNHGQYAKAIDFYRRSAMASSLTAPHFNMGLVFNSPDVSQELDAADAFRRALLLNPDYDKAKEQLELTTRKLIPLAKRARESAAELIRRDEHFQFFISPFEAFPLDGIENIDQLAKDKKIIKGAKGRLLRDIELYDGKVSWLDDFELDKSRALALEDELLDETKRSYHWAVFQNKRLLRFLTRGEIEHFVYSEDYFPQETLELLDDDPEFLAFLSKPFAQQYNLLLSRARERSEMAVIEALFDGRRWVTTEDQDACFRRAEQWVNDLVEGVRAKRVESESGDFQIGVDQFRDWLSRHHITDLFNLLPGHFRIAQTALVAEIRSLALSSYNDHDNAEMAHDILALCKQFRFKSEELNQRITEDFKAIDRVIAQQRFIKNITALVDAVRSIRKASGNHSGPTGLREAEELLKLHRVEEIFKQLPAETHTEQTELAAITRSLAVACYNKHGDAELSRTVLNLCKRFQIENEEFNELLEKDFKTIDEVILASQIVRRSPTAGAKGQDSAGCVGLMLVGLVIAFFAIGPCSSTKPTPSSRDTPPYIAPSPPTYNARPSQNNSESGSSSVYRVPSYVNAELERDKRAIDAEEATAKWLSSQIETLSREIDRERVSFDQTSQYAVDAFNRKVAAYNSLVEKVRVQDRVVNNLIESYNAKLRKYGR